MPLLTTAQLRQHIETGVDDSELQSIIDANEQEIIRRHGEHETGSFIHHSDRYIPDSLIVLPRAADSIVSITEHTLDGDTLLVADDYHMHTPYIILRRGGYYWRDHVVVEYIPRDENAIRKSVLIKLCQLDIHFSGFDYLKTPELTIDGADHQSEREKVLRQLRRKPVIA